MTLCPKPVRFLAINAYIVDCVCLPFNPLTLLPLCTLSARIHEKKEKEKEKRAISGFGYCIISSSLEACGRVYSAARALSFAVPVPNTH